MVYKAHKACSIACIAHSHTYIGYGRVGGGNAGWKQEVLATILADNHHGAYNGIPVGNDGDQKRSKSKPTLAHRIWQRQHSYSYWNFRKVHCCAVSRGPTLWHCSYVKEVLLLEKTALSPPAGRKSRGLFSEWFQWKDSVFLAECRTPNWFGFSTPSLAILALRATSTW